MSASEEEVAIRTAFKEYDVDNDGKIDISELCTLAQDLNLPFTDPDELTTALKALDENSSGAIDLEEFIHWWKGIKTTAVTSELQQKLVRALVQWSSSVVMPLFALG